MEGLNFGAILLGYLGVLVLGIASLLALILLCARRTKAARKTFAAGVLVTAGIAALASLSFLQKGYGFYVDGSESGIVLTALSLLLAGCGQFIAALRSPRYYGVVFGCAAVSMVMLAVTFLETDALPTYGAGQVLRMHSLSLPGVNLGLFLSLLLAVLSLICAIVPSDKKTAVILWTMLTGFGCIAGFAVGDACVTTRCTLIQSFPGSRPQLLQVKVDVLGARVSDVSAFATVPRGGLSLVRAVSPAQALWVYGPLTAGAALGFATGWVIARLLVR